MRWSLIASTLVHTAILLAAVVVLPSPDEYEVADQEAVPVEIVDVNEFSKRVAQAKDGEENVEKPAPKKEEKKVQVAPEAPALPQVAELPPLEELVDLPALAKTPEPEPVEPPKEVEKLPEPKPEPEPAPKKVETEPEKPKAAAPKPRRKPKIVKRKPKKKKKPKFDLEAITAVLDKSAEKPLLQKKTELTGTPRKAERNTSGEDTVLSATEKDWLIQHLSKCWIIPGGVKNAERLRITVDYQTDSQGNVVGNPRISSASSDAAARIAGESAVRAVLDCAPFDRFETFKNHKFRVNFDPKTMLNG